jgi:hypothetical protein
MPVNVMIIRALLNYYTYYGDNFKIECPTGSGKLMNLFEVAKEISERLSSIFLRDENGRRPVYGGSEKFQTDPNWRDLILFYEYFHGDNGAGLGASHQTGGRELLQNLFSYLEKWMQNNYLKEGSNLHLIKMVTTQKNKMKNPRYPSLYQINTRVWITE